MATKTSRDDFSTVAKDLLAKRAGYICSYPGCRRMTVAASEDRNSGLTMTGVAAHITAASSTGPRFDSTMSSEERSSDANGIWTCQIHGKFIDDNPSKCTTKELKRWKAQHETWVFDRVESGNNLFTQGISQLSFSSIGVFSSKQDIALGRNNVLVGPNEAGKTTVCQILAAFAGGIQWAHFDTRFDFTSSAAKGAYMSATYQNDTSKQRVKLSPQLLNPHNPVGSGAQQRMHVELNGLPAMDWPRASFRSLHFDDQYLRGISAVVDTFAKAISYLSACLGQTEDIIWDGLRDEIFATSLFGYRFHRTGKRKVDIQVPDGRAFYLPHKNLSTSEQHLAIADIAIKLVLRASPAEHWFLIFDTGFFSQLDGKGQALLFKKLSELDDASIQTLFCLSVKEDAEALKDIGSEKWVNATSFSKLTLHAFL